VLAVGVEHSVHRVPLCCPVLYRNELLVAQVEGAGAGVKAELCHVQEDNSIAWVALHSESLNAGSIRDRRTGRFSWLATWRLSLFSSR